MGPFTVGQIPANPQVFAITDDDGNLRDLSQYTGFVLMLITPSDQLITNAGTFDAYNPTNFGKLVFRWRTDQSPFTEDGTWQVQVKMTGAGALLDYSDIGTFDVNLAPAVALTSTWATTADVVAITNHVVDNSQVIAAQVIVEMVTNRTPNASASIRARDIIWLKRAVAYQAVWQSENPDIFTRQKVRLLGQDGVNTVFTGGDSIYMGPLAIRALKNVSWMKSRSLRMTSPFIDRQSDTTNPLIDDSILNWEPF